MASATVDLDGLPKVTVTSSGKGYSATVEILGIAPTRSISAEERFAGISSLDPPTVSARTRIELIRRATRATLNAIQATDESVTPAIAARVAYGVDYAIRDAFEKLGLDA